MYDLVPEDASGTLSFSGLIFFSTRGGVIRVYRSVVVWRGNGTGGCAVHVRGDGIDIDSDKRSDLIDRVIQKEYNSQRETQRETRPKNTLLFVYYSILGFSAELKL